jgi:hypothetical protein
VTERNENTQLVIVIFVIFIDLLFFCGKKRQRKRKLMFKAMNKVNNGEELFNVKCFLFSLQFLSKKEEIEDNSLKRG